METTLVLDTSVVIEGAKGDVTIFTAIEYPPCLKSSREIIFPDQSDYITSIEIADLLRENGTPVGAIDILIAAMCINRGFPLLTKDSDFKHIKNVVPDFKCIIQK